MKSAFKLVLIVALAFLAAYAGSRVYRAQQEENRFQMETAGYTAGDFTLQGPEGEVSLHDFRGEVVLIYFGYTYCPDVCPTSLATMGEAIRQLAPDIGVKGLFITIDPERDSLDKLAGYAPFFNPNITGLRASAPRILEVATRYSVYYQKVARGDKDYLMDHTSKIYLIDQQGELAGVIPHGATAQEIVERVKRLF